MEEKKTKRKLTAILSADVKGYSRLMQDDEEATVQSITAYREVITDLIQGHDGRVMDAKGDNVLAEFPSVVDAVRCGVKIQEELKVRNDELPENRRMEFRIGINLGDVIEEGETIYGDGVNIAARLEGLAEGGRICISRTAFDQVKNKLDVGYEYLGEHSVKNIVEPVRVYKVLTEPEYAGRVIREESPKPSRWQPKATTAIVILFVVAGALTVWNFYFRRPSVEPASVEKMAYPLPDKPSVAVLPFDNLSDDPKQKYFSDGLTEEIITALSKTEQLFVIARNSTFSYKGKPVKVQQVAEDLGIRYVLEGSVRKDAGRVRITAQLVDAIKGSHLWAERYDRDMKDVFAVQDEITQKVVTALQVKLTEGEQALVYSRGTTNLQAFLRLLKGREQINRWNIEGNALARETIKQVISLDPKYAVAYYLLAITHHRDVFNRSTSNPRESIAKAIKLTQKAIVLDDSLAEAHGLLGWLYVISRQHEHEKGIAQAEQALALNPNSDGAYKWLGVTLNYAGKHEEAITLHKKAIRLNPFPPTTLIYLNLACDYRDAERYEEVIPICGKALQKEPDLIFAHTLLASSYAQMGKLKEARAEAAEVLRIDPKFSVGYLCKKLPYKYDVDRKRVRDSLLKAGLPD